MCACVQKKETTGQTRRNLGTNTQEPWSAARVESTRSDFVDSGMRHSATVYFAACDGEAGGGPEESSRDKCHHEQETSLRQERETSVRCEGEASVRGEGRDDTLGRQDGDSEWAASVREARALFKARKGLAECKELGLLKLSAECKELGSAKEEEELGSGLKLPLPGAAPPVFKNKHLHTTTTTATATGARCRRTSVSLMFEIPYAWLWVLFSFPLPLESFLRIYACNIICMSIWYKMGIDIYSMICIVYDMYTYVEYMTCIHMM